MYFQKNITDASEDENPLQSQLVPCCSDSRERCCSKSKSSRLAAMTDWEIPFIRLRCLLSPSRKSRFGNLRRCAISRNRHLPPLRNNEQAQGALDRTPAILNSFPQARGEKSTSNDGDRTSTRSTVASMIHQTRARGGRNAAGEAGGKRRETERLIIVERASRVNVTLRNNLGRERVNAKSGVPIVRRGEKTRQSSSDAISKRNAPGITLIPETLGSSLSRYPSRGIRLRISRWPPVIYLSRRPPRGVSTPFDACIYDYENYTRQLERGNCAPLPRVGRPA
ncbi:hypothetical protein K0M31_004399 [Melipona bicolor]|uniref:Uncharacterized protein n=1 Tax=Melipona bicolor TaxID=60889 RepID=A0AA40FXP2_9HYME|nr:hypothetical protein K0M31_004399 [Melipona bicolor]